MFPTTSTVPCIAIQGMFFHPADFPSPIILFPIRSGFPRQCRVAFANATTHSEQGAWLGVPQPWSDTRWQILATTKPDTWRQPVQLGQEWLGVMSSLTAPLQAQIYFDHFFRRLVPLVSAFVRIRVAQCAWRHVHRISRIMKLIRSQALVTSGSSALNLPITPSDAVFYPQERPFSPNFTDRCTWIPQHRACATILGERLVMWSVETSSHDYIIRPFIFICLFIYGLKFFDLFI